MTWLEKLAGSNKTAAILTYDELDRLVEKGRTKANKESLTKKLARKHNISQAAARCGAVAVSLEKKAKRENESWEQFHKRRAQYIAIDDRMAAAERRHQRIRVEKRKAKELQKKAAAHQLTKRMREALLWTSASPSFLPGGEARKGWVKIVQPLLEKKAFVAGENNETRTYKLTARPWVLDRVEELLAAIQHLGQAGASRTIELWVDGDGPARLEVKRDGKRLKTPPDFSTDPEVIKLKGLG